MINFFFLIKKKILYLIKYIEYVYIFLLYIRPIKKIYNIYVKNNKIDVNNIYLIRWNNKINRLLYYGKYLYIGDNKNVDLLEYDVSNSFGLYNIDIEYISVYLINKHNVEYELKLYNDIISKVGQTLYFKILYKAIYDSNIYMLIYYYIQYYLNNYDIIQKIKFHIESDMKTEIYDISEEMILWDLINILK